MKQTSAVDFLIDELIKNAHLKDAIQNDFIRLNKSFEQAKAMEKEQIKGGYDHMRRIGNFRALWKFLLNWLRLSQIMGRRNI